MNHLLAAETFDGFLLSEAVVKTFAVFTIDGSLCTDFYDTETADRLKAKNLKQVPWSAVRSYCYSLIKGKLPPVSIRLVLSLPAEQVQAVCERSGSGILPEQVNGLFLNIHYTRTELTVTTGTSVLVFTLDKTLDQTFDAAFREFLVQHDIDFEIL